MKKPIAIDKADIKAFLGPGSKFEGKLSFNEMVRLDGVFSGEIESSDTLVVGETAEIDGNINVGALILSGSFKGHIKATTSVELRAPAKVEGKIETPSLKVEDKVVFNGEIIMPGGLSSGLGKAAQEKQK
ncbi:MAG: polymer-forming cytoskeletal protein [Deltaproteobacteria bacterium]|nr:polymer-forming cytoskeletal protein [Deltaproteobacteria bacterium]MCW8893448.1 polymer-forming cytoskeletal protein [Deltaproteobacteria bacterium]MCW9050631.1 polymer-forming cytoskeletal protein [Deltaproteobacteria bacterium]